MPNSLKKVMERDNGMTEVARISKKQMTRLMRINNRVSPGPPKRGRQAWTCDGLMARL